MYIVNHIKKRFKKLTLISVAAYIFILAVCIKGIYFYETQHPIKEELLPIHGIVKDVRLGGHGNATNLQLESGYGIHRYSSYYGKVWPGMEHIQPGDQVNMLAEKDKLNKNELIGDKRFYIWELIHRQDTIISYENIRKLVLGKEATVNHYINFWLIVGIIFLLIAYIRKILLSRR
jgi:hypothetical protein